MSASALKSAGSATTDLVVGGRRATLLPGTDGDGDVHVERYTGELGEDDLLRRLLQASAQRALVDHLPIDPRRGHLTRGRNRRGDVDLADAQVGVAAERVVDALLQRRLVLVELAAHLVGGQADRGRRRGFALPRRGAEDDPQCYPRGRKGGEREKEDHERSLFMRSRGAFEHERARHYRRRRTRRFG